MSRSIYMCYLFYKKMGGGKNLIIASKEMSEDSTRNNGEGRSPQGGWEQNRERKDVCLRMPSAVCCSLEHVLSKWQPGCWGSRNQAQITSTSNPITSDNITTQEAKRNLSYLQQRLRCELFLGSGTNICSPQIRHQWQNKETIAPLSSLVNQGV